MPDEELHQDQIIRHQISVNLLCLCNDIVVFNHAKCDSLLPAGYMSSAFYRLSVMKLWAICLARCLYFFNKSIEVKARFQSKVNVDLYVALPLVFSGILMYRPHIHTRTHTFFHSHTCLYSFPAPLRAGSWVGLDLYKCSSLSFFATSLLRNFTITLYIWDI